MALIAQAATLRLAGAVPAFLRRLPHQPRGEHARSARRRADPRHDRRRPGARPSRPRARPRASRSCAAPRTTPTRSSRRARPPTRSTPPCPGIVQAAMDRFAGADRPAVPPVRLRRPAGRRARDRADGLGRRDRARDGAEYCAARGEKVGVLQVRLFRPFAAEAFLAALPATRARASRCWSRPRSRAPPASRCIWTWSTDAGAGGGGRRARDHAARGRRALRPVVEGLPAGAGQGGVRRTRASRSRATASPSASSTT